MESHPTVKRRLPTEGQEDPLWTLLLDHLLDKEGSDGEEVDLIGYPLGGLYGSDIGVHEDGVYPLLS